MEEKNKLVDTYQLTLEKGWYWQKKENMSHWKVFKENHFKEKSLLWLIFRLHKLCNDKYLYFSKNLKLWQPVHFDPDRMLYSEIVLEKDWVTTEAFMHKKTKRIVTITKLQQIKDKNVFINLIEVITGEKFPE